MAFIRSALEQHAQLAHATAGLVIVLALLFLGFELLKIAFSRSRAGHAPGFSAPQDDSLAQDQLTRTSASGAPPERDSALEVPQVFLLCQDDIEPDEATFPNAQILVSARGETDVGKKRTRNEDSLLLLPEHALYAVADGMGGHNGGERASALAVDALREAFEQTSFQDELLSDTPIPRRGLELATAFVRANRVVFHASKSEAGLAEMGTTLVAARFSLDKQRVYVAHVGDSRCYRFRGSKLTQLTTDHTMRHLGLEGPHANDLFRALGIEQNVMIDLVVDIPRPEDLYLLCSDGLPKMVSDEQLEEALAAEADLESAVYRLIELANDAGGRDNVTVILVRVGDQPAVECDRFADGTGQSRAEQNSA